MSVYYEKSAGQNHHQIHESVEQSCRCLEHCHVVIGLLLYFLESIVAFGKFSCFKFFCCESLDHPLSKQRVLNPGIQFSDLYPLSAKGGTQILIKNYRYNSHNRHTDKYQHGKPDTVSAQNDEAYRKLDPRNEEFLRTMMRKLSHLKQIVGYSPHNLTDFGIGIIGISQPL